MRNVRKGIAAAIVLAIGGGLAVAPAGAAGSGTGSASARTTVVAIDVGDGGSLLAVRLLADEAGASIDKAKGGPSAFGKLTGVNVTSTAVPALSITPKPAETKQPGGEKKETRGSVNLAEPYEGVTVDSAVLAGTLGIADLASDAGSTLATSSVSAVLTSATLAGALAKVDGATSTLQAKSGATASETTRTVSVDEVVVLDLGSLLDGLGLSLLDLPVSTLVGLLDTLDTVVPGVGDAAAVNEAIDGLQADINDLTGETSLPTGTTVGDVVDAINGLGLGELVDPGTETVIEAADPVAQVNALIDELQAALAAVLSEGVQALDDAPLLVAKGAEASVTTKAVDKAGDSVADATAGIGSIEVGGVVVQGVDLVDGAQAVANTVTNVNEALTNALGGIDPGLADLVKVSLFDRASSRGVSTSGEYVQAADGVTVLSASVSPPSTLAAIVQAVKDQTGVGEVITGNDAVPPTVSGAMGAFEAQLGSGVQAAAAGVDIRIAEVLGSSEFRPSAAQQAPGNPADSSTNQDDGGRNELPRTGGNSWAMAALATLLIALGLGFREWTRMPVPATVRAVGRHMR